MQQTKGKINKIAESVKSLIVAVLVASIFRWLIFENCSIPTSSMEKTLLVGDYIIVSKLHYGARFPQTLLQIPLTHQNIWGTNIPSYLNWIKLPYFRLPGISKVKRNDKIVFNNINEYEAKHMPPDLTKYYIKRCIAVSGDTFAIHNANVLINGDIQTDPINLQFRYYLQSRQDLDHDFFSRYDITEYLRADRDKYLVYTTRQTANLLKSNKLISEIHLFPMPADLRRLSIYPNNEHHQWDEDNFGPLVIPAKGMNIPMSVTNIHFYGNVIKKYEGHKDVRIDNDKLYINGEVVENYTFKQNYYFMMGDNRHNSVDSRFWGLLPEDRIVGKAVMVLFSIDKYKSFPFNIRFKRLLSMSNT
jgi:signal peptidase I